MKLSRLRKAIANRMWAWSDMLTSEVQSLAHNYDGTNSSLLASKTYAAIEKEIRHIMCKEQVSCYNICSFLNEMPNNKGFIAEFAVSYLLGGIETDTFKIETDC